MLELTCPVCGVTGEESDFHYGGEAHIRRPASADPESVTDEMQRDYLYLRANPRGLHREQWQCTRGCGKWFNAVRDTVTMDFKTFYKMGETAPDLSKFEGNDS